MGHFIYFFLTLSMLHTTCSETPIPMKEYTLEESSDCSDGNCPYYIIDIQYPAFEGEKMNPVNGQIKELIDSVVQQFYEDLEAGYEIQPDIYGTYKSDVLGSYEVTLNQDGFLSFYIDINTSLPLGTEYPGFYRYYFNYYLNPVAKLRLEEGWELTGGKTQWEDYVRQHLNEEGEEKVPEIVDFLLHKENIELIFYIETQREPYESLRVDYETFQQFFKPIKRFSFIEKS